MKTVLITGASRGIGRATALALAQNQNWRIAVHYHRNKKMAEEVVEKILSMGCDACIVQADITDRMQVQKMIEAVHTRLGMIDVLINNAGISQQKMFCDILPEEWHRMFAVSVEGAYHCCQHVLPDMIAKKQGCLLMVSSMWGITGASCEVHYSAAKAALIGMTKALAKELAPSGIRVNAVAPGVILTDMCKHLDTQTLESLKEETPLGRLGTPEDVAQALVYLSDEKSSFVTGQIWGINGGFLI